MTKRNIIVIGTSACGVNALCELNKHLPEDLDASNVLSGMVFRRKASANNTPKRSSARSGTAARKLKERIVLHERLVERRRNEDELRRRLEESVTTAREDLTLLRDVLERI